MEKSNHDACARLLKKLGAARLAKTFGSETVGS